MLFISLQEPSKEGSCGSSKGPKPHKLTKEHRERPRKDSESKATSKDDRDGSSKSGRDPSSSSSSKKPSEIKVKEEVKVLPKAAFKEPKLTLKESKMEGMSPKGGGAGNGGGGGGGGGGPAESKAPGKRPSTVESPKPSAKKAKKGSSEGPKGTAGGPFTGTSPRVSSSSAASQAYAEKKPPKDKGRWAKGKNDTQEPKEPKKLPESEESNSEDEASSKSEVCQRHRCFKKKKRLPLLHFIQGFNSEWFIYLNLWIISLVQSLKCQKILKLKCQISVVHLSLKQYRL